MRITIVFSLIGLLLVLNTGRAYAAEGAGELAVAAGDGGSSLGLNPVAFFFIILAICTGIGMVAVLGGVGGGVIFTPLFMGFTSIDSLVVRATGLFVAMSGSLIAARPFLRKGLANFHIQPNKVQFTQPR